MIKIKIKQRFIWLLFLSFAFLILIIEKGFKAKNFIKFLKEIRSLIRRKSKYIEDGDYRIVRKRRRFL